jgi:AcrR family transcriptional regulator
MVNKFCPLSGRGRGRPRSDEPALSREAILRQAFQAFAREGYEGLSMRQLASECGLSNSMLHHHFNTKRELWFEVADSVFAPLFGHKMALLDTQFVPGDYVQTLRQAISSSFALAGEATEALAFMFRESEGDDERGEYVRRHYLDPYMARINAIVAEGKAAGQIADLPVAGMHAVVVGVMRFLLMPGMLRQELAPHLADTAGKEQFTEALTDMVLGGFIRR